MPRRRVGPSDWDQVGLGPSAWHSPQPLSIAFGPARLIPIPVISTHASPAGLRTSLKARLHGQPLVEETVIRLLKRHLANDEPEKALVLSFHGWTGSGKNFVSRIIAEHIYDHGMKSRYVNLFVSTVHFPHKHKVAEYQVC